MTDKLNFLILLVLFFSTISSLSLNKNKITTRIKSKAVSSTLMSGYSMRNTYLESNSGKYRLWMQSDGNLVLYCVNGGGAIWSSETNPLTDSALSLQSDGNLVIYSKGVAKWSSQTATKGSGQYTLSLQDDGNLVLYNNSAGGKAIWWTGTNGFCDTRRLCFTVASVDSGDGTANNIRLKYAYNGKGIYQCWIYNGVSPGQEYCCDGVFKKLYSGGTSINGHNDKRFELHVNGGDGVRVNSIKAESFTEDKWYSPNSHQNWDNNGSLDGYMAGTCYRRFWLDRDSHGKCNNVVVKMVDHFSSSNGDCAYTYCNESLE